MISNRVMFVFITLLLTLVITISTAPIVDKQLVDETITTTEPAGFKDDSHESSETSDEQVIRPITVELKDTNTTVPVTATDVLLVVNTTEVSNDVVDTTTTNNHPFVDNGGELPATPVTEEPKSS